MTADQSKPSMVTVGEKRDVSSWRTQVLVIVINHKGSGEREFAFFVTLTRDKKYRPKKSENEVLRIALRIAHSVIALQFVSQFALLVRDTDVLSKKTVQTWFVRTLRTPPLYYLNNLRQYYLSRDVVLLTDR